MSAFARDKHDCPFTYAADYSRRSLLSADFARGRARARGDSATENTAGSGRIFCRRSRSLFSNRQRFGTVALQ
jgi:hypothetical protein